MTDARGNTTSHEYDARNRLRKRTDPLGRVETYTYDFNGNLRTVTDRKGQVTTHTYDAQNRRIRTGYADGSSITYGYDPAGNLIAATDSLTGTITRSYDALDRLLSETTPQGAVTYTYDQTGRRTQMQVNGLAPATYAYDAASRLTGITQGQQSATLAYDPSNRRTSLVLPNDIVVTYTYDEVSRLIAQTYSGPNGLLGDLTYTYDPNTNRLATGGSWARTGIPTSIPTSSYDAANQQLAFGVLTQIFDPNGNLLSQTDGTGTTTYTWDARNRLVAITGPGVTATFAYDAFGRRISKTINGVTTTFHYDGEDMVQESGATGATAYLRTLAIDEALTRTDSTGMNAYLTGPLGSTVALTTSEGAVGTEYSYEPFGSTQASGPLGINPLQFTGRENDGTGLYFYRARDYAPSLKRFLQEDSIGFTAGANFYTYVSNNPLRWSDPRGLIEWPFDAPMPWNEGADTMPPLLPAVLVPTYGNWGGWGWSGGQRGEVGPLPPIDSMDACFKAHDECWAERECRKDSGPVRRQCDRELVNCLSSLQWWHIERWPQPPQNPWWARVYRGGAKWAFWGLSRL